MKQMIFYLMQTAHPLHRLFHPLLTGLNSSNEMTLTFTACDRPPHCCNEQHESSDRYWTINIRLTTFEGVYVIRRTNHQATVYF